MRFSILFVLTFVLFSISNAQTSSFNDGELNQISESLSSNFIISKQSRDIKGDPYLNPDFTSGNIILRDNVKTDTLPLRFNTEKNIVEFMKDKNYYGVQRNKINGFTLFGNPSDITFKNGFKSDDNDISRTTLLRVIYDGYVKLLAHHKTELKENIASYGSANQKDEYVDNVNFYIVEASGAFSEVKLKRKDIVGALGKDLRNKLSNYADENNLNFDREADLVQILKYHDKLTSNAKS